MEVTARLDSMSLLVLVPGMGGWLWEKVGLC